MNEQGQSGNGHFTTLQAALAYQAAGLSIIPIRRDGTKAPGGAELPTEWDPAEGKNKQTWKPFQARLASGDEVRKWFERRNPPGVAIIGGAVSGSLECIDFDREAEAVFPEWSELVENECPGLVARLSVVRTPKPGFHVRYRCPELTIPGNTKLAMDPFAPKDDQCLIETRGEGGYALAPGCPPQCHESGRTYDHFSGPKLSQIGTITAVEREVLIRCARSFDRSPQEERGPLVVKANGAGPLPGDDYNRRGPDWPEILEAHGWKVARQNGAVRYWRRPGKDAGWSATTGRCTSQKGWELFAVFSSNASPFEGPAGGKLCSCYSKFSAYGLLNHGGDFGAAARDLGEQGYGERPEQRRTGRAPSGDGGEDPWEQPVPLGGDYATPAPPLDGLPEWLRRWVQAEAEATQTPADLSLILALAECGAALAKKYRVMVRTGWAEPVNIFGVVALPSGERKSVVFRDALAPAVEYERQEQVRMAPIIAEAAAEHRILEAQLKVVESKAAKELDAEEHEKLKSEAKELAKRLAAHQVPNPPEIFCDDVTPEKLSNLIAKQGGRMLQASAEGTAFEIAKGRYSETANFDVYLKGHAGDPLRVGRVGREGEKVDQPALSAALAVQPDVIQGLAEQATMRGRGFLARFLYALPTSRVGTRAVAPSPIPADVARDYHDYMLALWNLPGTVDASGQPAPHWLRFSVEADNAMRAFEAWLEPQLADGQELSFLAGWANKLAGAVARIAACLHVADAIGDGQARLAPIAERIVAAAIALGRDYLLPHAIAAFGRMGADPRQEHAVQILRWLRRRVESAECSEHAPLCVSRRDIHQAHRRRFRSADDLDPVLELIVKHGWLRATGEGKPGRGHPAPKFDINPAIRTALPEGAPHTHCTQRTQPGGAGGASECNEDSESAPDGHGDAWEGD